MQFPPPPLAQGKAPSSSHGGKKRSGSNVAIVPHGGERPPQKGINLAQGKAPSSSHGGKKRSGSNVAIVPHGGERPPRKGINPKKRGEKGGKKGGGILHLPPLMAILSDVLQVQTPLVPMNLPNCFLKMSDLKPFPMMSLTKNTSVHYARWSIRLVVMIHKIHRFLFSNANIDFADYASRI